MSKKGFVTGGMGVFIFLLGWVGLSRKNQERSV